mgnify:CR=1 FL=1
MRQYIAQNMPDKNGFLTISGKDFKYLSQVLRLKCNDEIWVRFPDGSLRKMFVKKVQSKMMIFTLSDDKNLTDEKKSKENVEASSIKPTSIEYWVFQFVPMHAQLDLIIRQCTECGISKIVPILGQRSPCLNEQAIKAKDERFKRLVKEARQQSGSPVDTKIFEPMKLENALKIWLDEKNLDEKSLNKSNNSVNSDMDIAENNKGIDSVAFVLHEADIANKTLFEYASSAMELSKNSVKKVALAIGPEGGMTKEEVTAFENAGFNLIHFETNVLRCETACLYGIASIQSIFTEYKQWQKRE